MSSLSVVVPRLGTNALFENTLASILRYRMPHHQVIVVQSDLHADTYGLEEEVEFVEVPGKPNLACYFNNMLEVVKGDVINVIRPGIEVTHQWFSHGIRYLQSGSIGCVACSLVSASYRDEVISCGLTTSRTMFPRHITGREQRPIGPSSWAGFYRHDLLRKLGKFDESISDGFFGLDLAFSIRGLGLGCGLVTDRVLTIANPDLLHLRARPQSGRDAQRMVQRHLSVEDQKMGSWAAIGSDCLKSFWRPSHWAQVAGRFSANNKQATDRAFARRMALAKQELAGSFDSMERLKAA